MMNIIVAYAEKQMTTPVLKSFMQQFFMFYNDSKTDFAEEVKKIFPKKYTTMRTVWNIQERFTDYSFENLHITIDYCAYFMNKNQQQTISHELPQRERDCLEKESRRFEFVIQLKDKNEKEIERFLGAKAKELNTQIYQHFRLLIQKENNEAI